MNSSEPDAPAHQLRLSQQLEHIIKVTDHDRLSFTELAAHLHYRAWGALLFIFAAINVLPLPPGTTVFFAIPVLLVSGQMVAGRKAPWFPARLNRRGITKAELQRLLGKVEWLERRTDRIIKPRLEGLTGPGASRLIGAACFLLALIIAIPVPLLHHAPAASVSLFALALIYRDGALVIVASIAAVLSIILDALIIGSGVVALAHFASWIGL
ncbi:MAG: exopolysaccharide biosynthesis protein [Sphingomicrobium sp.]